MKGRRTLRISRKLRLGLRNCTSPKMSPLAVLVGSHQPRPSCVTRSISPLGLLYLRQLRVLSFLSNCQGGECRSNNTAQLTPDLISSNSASWLLIVRTPLSEYGPTIAQPARDKGACGAGGSAHDAPLWRAKANAVSAFSSPSADWFSRQPAADRCERSLLTPIFARSHRSA